MNKEFSIIALVFSMLSSFASADCNVPPGAQTRDMRVTNMSGIYNGGNYNSGFAADFSLLEDYRVQVIGEPQNGFYQVCYQPQGSGVLAPVSGYMPADNLAGITGIDQLGPSCGFREVNTIAPTPSTVRGVISESIQAREMNPNTGYFDHCADIGAFTAGSPVNVVRYGSDATGQRWARVRVETENYGIIEGWIPADKVNVSGNTGTEAGYCPHGCSYPGNDFGSDIQGIADHILRISQCGQQQPPESSMGGSCAPPTRNCAERNRMNINRHAGGSFAPWLVDLVNQASMETSEHATANAGNSCASPAMMMTLMDQESTFHPMSSNSWNDHGIAQFQLGTAEATLRYAQQAAAPDSPLRNTVQRGLTWKPTACSFTSVPWARDLSQSCFNALQRECVSNGRLVASLYCPQFAVRLQALHLKQICSEPFHVDSRSGQHPPPDSSRSINLTEVLLGDGDPAAEARFVASRYNRGYRIYTSAVHYRSNHGRWPSASDYGPLWATRRPLGFSRSRDPAGGGSLRGHVINRCYNWRTVGLCGGLGGTLYDNYRIMTCEAAAAQARSQGAVQ